MPWSCPYVRKRKYVTKYKIKKGWKRKTKPKKSMSHKGMSFNDDSSDALLSQKCRKQERLSCSIFATPTCMPFSLARSKCRIMNIGNWFTWRGQGIFDLAGYKDQSMVDIL